MQKTIMRWGQQQAGQVLGVTYGAWKEAMLQTREEKQQEEAAAASRRALRRHRW